MSKVLHSQREVLVLFPISFKGQIFITLDMKCSRSNFQVTKFSVTTSFQKCEGLNLENLRLKYKYLLFWPNGCREAWYIWLRKDKMEEHPFPYWDTQGTTALLQDASVSPKQSLDGIKSFDRKSVQQECAHTQTCPGGYISRTLVIPCWLYLS